MGFISAFKGLTVFFIVVSPLPIFERASHLGWGGGFTQWCGWLGHCATSWKAADSISDGVIGIVR